MIRILKYCWFIAVMKSTGLLPDFQAVMRFRGWLLRPCFKSCGRNFQICSHAMVVYPSSLSIGRDVYIGYGCWVHAVGGVTLEDEVMLGPYAVIVSNDHTAVGGSYRFGEAVNQPVVVKRGAWIGSHGVVLKGVTIGAGAVLAAGGVATRDIAGGCVAGGVPAKIISQATRSV